MGYDVLSMNATNLLKVKWVIRNVSLIQARRMLAKVLRMDNSEEISSFLNCQLLEAGLGRVVPTHGRPIRAAATQH